MEYFCVDRSRKYVIYGAGGNCRRIQKLFRSAGICMDAIIDRRAEEIKELDGTPVFTLEQLSGVDRIKEDRVVILSVKNVFMHVDLVRTLLEKGYKNIIYKPLPVLRGECDAEWDSIDCAYQAIVEEGHIYELVGKKIACSRRDHLVYLKDELIMKESADEILCRIPIELVRNYDREDAFGRLPMGAFYPLINIYQYMYGYITSDKWEEIRQDFLLYCSDWVERSGSHFSESLKESLLDSRIDVFDEMRKKEYIDPDFFIRSAVTVRWDLQCFYLTASGRNRVSFLAAEGKRFIPARMRKEDYVCWVNYSIFEEIKTYLERMHVDRLFTDVPHPMLISYATETTGYVPLFCMPVIKEIFKSLHWKVAERKEEYFQICLLRFNEIKEKLQICVAMRDEGCLGRLLIMYGLNCVRLYDSQREREISRMIDQLLYIKEDADLSTEREPETVRRCRILIMDSRVSGTVVDDFLGDTVFLLWWENSDVCWLDRFAKRELLFRTIWMKEKVSGWKLEI